MPNPVHQCLTKPEVTRGCEPATLVLVGRESTATLPRCPFTYLFKHNILFTHLFILVYALVIAQFIFIAHTHSLSGLIF